LNEEINLLYVAITRAKSQLFIPEDLVPVGFAPSKQIRVLRKVDEEDSKSTVHNRNQAIRRPEKKGSPVQRGKASWKSDSGSADKSTSMGEIRTKCRGAYKPWTKERDNELTELYCEGVPVSELASYFERTKGAIRMRIKKLDLEGIY